MPKFNVGSIDLSEDEVDWLSVAINLSDTSIRAQIAQIVQGHIIRFKPHYRRKVAYVARKYGLTWEEAFQRLTVEPSPFTDMLPVVENAPIRQEEEFSNFGCEVEGQKINEQNTAAQQSTDATNSQSATNS